MKSLKNLKLSLKSKELLTSKKKPGSLKNNLKLTLEKNLKLKEERLKGKTSRVMMIIIEKIKKVTNTVKKRKNNQLKNQREEVAEEEEAVVEEVVETMGTGIAMSIEITEAQEKIEGMTMMEATLDRNMAKRIREDEIKKTQIICKMPIRNLPEREVKDPATKEPSSKQPFHLLMKISPHYDEDYWF